MSKMTLVMIGLIAIAGCGKKKGGAADTSAKMTEFKDAMCKCKAGEADCAKKVLDDQKKWGDEMAKTADKDAKPDPAEAAEMAKKMEPIMADYTKCMTAAMTPAAPPKPPEDKPEVGGICPAGSTGEGTSSKPCVGKGRVLEAEWTGKWGPNAMFKITNKTDKKIDFAQACVWYYDKDGKWLKIDNKPLPECSSSSGGVISIGPKETKEQGFGHKEAEAPKGTVKVEMEFNKVGWPGAKEGDYVYWENDKLDKLNRPLGGHPDAM
jgi:hypothetical protein